MATRRFCRGGKGQKDAKNEIEKKKGRTELGREKTQKLPGEGYDHSGNRKRERKNKREKNRENSQIQRGLGGRRDHPFERLQTLQQKDGFEGAARRWGARLGTIKKKEIGTGGPGQNPTSNDGGLAEGQRGIKKKGTEIGTIANFGKTTQDQGVFRREEKRRAGERGYRLKGAGKGVSVKSRRAKKTGSRACRCVGYKNKKTSMGR